MDTALREVVRDIRAKPHYREVDYESLAREVGEEFLLRRLREQLEVYERVARRRRTISGRVTRTFFRRGSVAGLWCVGGLARARRLARTPVGVTREVWSSKLPHAFDGLRVLHLTDFHFDFLPEMPELLEPLLAEVPFDLCVLTGDYRGETFGPYRESLDHLGRVRPLLGKEVYAVLGNHDNIEIVPPLREMGIRPLVNEGVWLEREGERILLGGIDDAHMYRTHSFGEWAEPAVEAFSILLSHTPEVYREAEAAGFDLMWSGHTHGGQICLPGGVPLVAHASRTPRRMVRGEWQWKGLRGYTSRGIGVSSVDCRFWCPPEYTVHVLRRGESEASGHKKTPALRG